MLLVFVYIILALYGICLLMIFMYSLSQLNLLFNYFRYQKFPPVKKDIALQDDLPFVTIQLPVYNEKYVVKRLLECVEKIQYPRQKLQVQLLDDSTDESLQENKLIVERLQNKGFDIVQVTRKDRSNYKAGALAQGLQTAKGEFIAIFDADFLPGADWLQKSIPYFIEHNIGAVQTRWGHINRNFSWLTRVQAFALDAHFTLEQSGRNAANYFMNFNGTAGIWRKECILDAGNWSGDTLTEDLDLSYRAQLRGWRFVYLEDVVAPAELPMVISAARSQQTRWNKGGAENFIKLFFRIVKDKNVSAAQKIQAIFHLGNSSMFLFVFLVSFLSVPMLFIKNEYAHLDIFFSINAFFLVSTLILFCCHWVVYKKLHGGGATAFFPFLKIFFLFYTLALGFSLHNSLAVLEAFFHKKTAFIRTPKFNVVQLTDNWKGNSYVNRQISLHAIIEVMLFLYYAFAIYSAFVLKDFAILPFHIMLFLGFGYVAFNSFKRAY